MTSSVDVPEIEMFPDDVFGDFSMQAELDAREMGLEHHEAQVIGQMSVC